MGRHLQHGPARIPRHRGRRMQRRLLPHAALASLLLLATAWAAPGAASSVAGGMSSTSTPPQIIPLSRRRRQHREPPGIAPSGGDKGQAARLTGFEQDVFAYFASLQVVGTDPSSVQAIDVLVDTGSTHLLMPSSLCDVGSCSTFRGPVLQRLDLEAAGAMVVGCDDPRCQGSCTHELLARRGLLGRDGDAPDPSCGPFGGICQRPSQDSGSLSRPYCLVFDSYADGSWALGPLVTTPAIRLAGVNDTSVTLPLFGAISDATPDFFEAPQGGGILGMAMGRELAERGPGDCSTPCLTPLLDRLWEAPEQQGQQQQQGKQASTLPNCFSIVGQGDGAALLIVGAGGDDPATAPYHKGPLRYSPMRRPWGYYIVGVLGLEIPLPTGGTEKVAYKEPDRGKKTKKGRGTGAILDTGTTGLFFPMAAYRFFQATLQAHYCHVPYICSSVSAPTADKQASGSSNLRGGALRRGRELGEEEEEDGGERTAVTVFDSDDTLVPWSDQDLARLPTLTMLLQSEREGDEPLRVELGPRQYLSRSRDEEGNAFYGLAVSGMENGGGDDDDDGAGYLLGEALLNNYFVEFDREAKRVGFAPAMVADG